MPIPILTRRRERREAELTATIDAAVDAQVEKTLQPAIIAAQQNSTRSGATYNPERLTSNPFDQTAGNVGGHIPLPRPDASFDSLFGPGYPFTPDPLDPLGTNGRTMPRRAQYLVAQNLQLLDREVPWTALKWLATECDIVNRCIEIIQDAMVGLDWSWGFSPQILNQIMQENGETNSAKAQVIAREKYGAELQRVTTFFEYPDKRMGYTFSQWLTEMIWAHLVYDGICIYPQYNLGGELISLSNIDTSTIKILIDNQGYLPQPPAPAYQQILYGFPRGEYQAEGIDADGKVPNGFQSDQLAYYIRRPRAGTVYGYPQVEECMTIGATYLARQAWMRGEYTNGVTPRLFMETASTELWGPEQLAYYEQIMNDRLSGQINRRQQMFMLRPGMIPHQMESIEETYKAAYDEFLVLQIAAKFGVPQSMMGIQMRSSIGGNANKGQGDLSEQFATDALKQFVIGIINDMARRFMNIGPEITITCDGGGNDDDDYTRAQSDASDVGAGIRTRNEIRAERGIPLMDEPEADQLAITTGTGVSFLAGALEAQKAQQDISQQQQATSLDMLQNPQKYQTQNGGDDNGGNGNSKSGQQPSASGAGQDKASPAGNSKPSGANADNDDSGNKPVKPAATATKSEQEELGSFLRFASKRQGRQWRDFEFESVDSVVAVQLNRVAEKGEDLSFVKEAIDLLAKRDDTPSKAGDTERLMTYWAEGEGAAKIGWGASGDFDRCRLELGKYVPPGQLDGLCANLHHRATGAWPGHAPGEEHHKALDVSQFDFDFSAFEVLRKEPQGLEAELHDRLVDYYAPAIAHVFQDAAGGINAAINAARAEANRVDKAAEDDILAKVGPEGYIHGWIKVGVGEVKPGDLVRFKEAGSTSPTTVHVRTISESGRTVRGTRMKFDSAAGHHVPTHIKESSHVMPRDGEVDKYNSDRESGL